MLLDLSSTSSFISLISKTAIKETHDAEINSEVPKTLFRRKLIAGQTFFMVNKIAPSPTCPPDCNLEKKKEMKRNVFSCPQLMSMALSNNSFFPPC